MSVIKKSQMQKIKRESSGVYGKRPSMYDPLLKEIEGLKEDESAYYEGTIPKPKEGRPKPVDVPFSYQRAMSLRSKVEKYLDREYEFDFVENEEVSAEYKQRYEDNDGEVDFGQPKTAYNVFVYLKTDDDEEDEDDE